LIIPSAIHDDSLSQAREPGEPSCKALEKAGSYPKWSKVTDNVIEAGSITDKSVILRLSQR
jgi:hypothetical protein